MPLWILFGSNTFLIVFFSADGAEAGVLIPPGAEGSVSGTSTAVHGRLPAAGGRAGASTQAVLTADAADGSATA